MTSMANIVTLKAWIRFKKDNRAVFLTLYNATSSHDVLLQISHDSISFLDSKVNFNQSIADGYWHFVAISMSPSSLYPVVVLNGKTLKTDGPINSSTVLFPASLLSIGSVYNGSAYVDSGFVGQFSQLSLFDTPYDGAMFNCSYYQNGMCIKKLYLPNRVTCCDVTNQVPNSRFLFRSKIFENYISAKISYSY